MSGRALLLGVIGLAIAPRARAGVVINEVFADAASVDANCDGVTGTQDDELVEIVNLGPADVDLSGATLSDAIGVRHTFAAGTILAPWEAVVVFGAGAPQLDGTSASPDPWCVALPVGVRVVVADSGSLGLNNTGDTVTLADAGGAALDAVTYGSEANADVSIVRDPELTGAVFVQHPGVAVSPGTLVGGGPFDALPADTGSPDTGGDTGTTAVIDTGSPDTAAPFVPSPLAGRVVVNELLVNPHAVGADGTHEWIELRNVSAAAVDLAGWSIERAKSSWGVRHTFGPLVLEPGDHLLVGESQVADADVLLPEGSTLDLGQGTSSGDAVRLVDAAGLPVDTVIYGPDNADGFLDDRGVAPAVGAPPMGPDASIARIPDGADTDDASADFWAIASPTPGAPNLDPRDLCADGAEAEGVVINELDASTTHAEWVEIHNGAAAAVDLSGWTLAYGTQGFTSTVPLPDGLTLEPGGFLVVGAIVEASIQADLSMGNATSSSDGVRLEDCVGGVVDTVVYGSPNDDGFVDDSGEVATSLAPAPASGSTLARVADGADTDRSGDDFVLQVEASPGGPNPAVVPVVCAPSTGVVTINEILPDPVDADDGLEWIELHNAADEEVSVAGWTISAGTKDFDDTSVTIPGGATIPAGGWLVIGGVDVAEAQVVASFSLGNGTGGDGVRLFDCEGAVVDTVLYGEDAADGLPDDAGVPVEPYGDPGAGDALARAVDGADTDAAADWVVRGTPTPGASNMVQAGGGSSEPPSRGCGCAGGPPDATAPQAPKAPGEGGCATVPLPLGGLEALLAALVSLRRRRRSTA